MSSESTPLLQNGTTSISGSEVPVSRRQRWTSIGIANLISCLLLVQATIVWPSLWPYMTEIDPTTTQMFYGVSVMAYNFGACVTSPIFGYWTNRLQQSRIPATIGLSVNILGNVLMAFAGSVPAHGKWVILISRTISGIGSGVFSSLFTYVVMASSLKERNVVLSIRAATNSLALMSGPGLQAAFVPIGYPGFIWSIFQFNMYTAPAYFNIIMGLINIMILQLFFHEYWISAKDMVYKNKSNTIRLKPYDRVAMLVCLLVRFVYRFCFGYDSTIGSPFTMIMFRWPRAKAVLYNGIIQSASGGIDFVGNLFVGSFVLRYVQERVMIVLGLLCLFLFYVISFSWPGLPMIKSDVQGVVLNQTIAPETECNYDWCDYTTRVYLWQYILAFAFLTLGLSVGLAPDNTLYTKVIGPRKQGITQGIFASTGQFAMTVGPVICSTLFSYYGPRIAWIVGAIVSASTIVVVMATFRRLVPYRE